MIKNKIYMVLAISLMLILVAGLIGCTGPQGAAGGTGATGPTGPARPQGPAGPQGIAGPQGPAGSKGPAGIQGPAGPTCQIVVTWNPDDYNGYGHFAAVDVRRSQKVWIKGAGFDPDDSITLTINMYDVDTLLGKKVTVDETGAFAAYRTIPSKSAYAPTSVKAWINTTESGDEVIKGDLLAVWPLEIVQSFALLP